MQISELLNSNTTFIILQSCNVNAKFKPVLQKSAIYRQRRKISRCLLASDNIVKHCLDFLAIFSAMFAWKNHDFNTMFSKKL